MILSGIKHKGIPVALLFIFAGLSSPVLSQSKSFVQKYAALAHSLSETYGIPSSVILAIAIVESSSGTSRNCKLLNNFFGIVGKNNLLKSKGVRTRYKQYTSDTASFTDFCKLIARKRFYAKLKGSKNHTDWVVAISKAGYSEVPETWKQRILATIKKNHL
jgi:Bax protein